MWIRWFWILLPLTALLLLISATQAVANVGSITDLRGQGEVVRGPKKMPAAARLPVAMKDTIRTGNGRLQITFQDSSVVKVTEQSRLIIDEFVYNPKTNGGKMGVRFAAGTARFIGGKMNRPNINLKTPTATIGVRGTDFTASVDETGKSMFILLPGDDGHIGEITVSTDAGIVVLNQAFQSTTVITGDAAPSRPVILNISLSLIDNMIMVSPPPVLEGSEVATQQSVEEALFDLGQDFLKDDSLQSDSLATNEEDRMGQSFFDDASVSAGKAIARIAPATPAPVIPGPPATVVPQQTVSPVVVVTTSTVTTPSATVPDPTTPAPETPSEPPTIVVEDEPEVIVIEDPVEMPVDIQDDLAGNTSLETDFETSDPSGNQTSDGSFELTGTALGFDLSTKINTTVVGNTIRFYRESNGIISIKTHVDSSINISITNDFKTHDVTLNKGSTDIVIVQKK